MGNTEFSCNAGQLALQLNRPPAVASLGQRFDIQKSHVGSIPRSPHGAFIGGLIVGVVGEVVVGIGIISPGYKLAVVFVVLITVILLRPQGLFGSRE